MPQSETERGKEIYLYFVLARLQFRKKKNKDIYGSNEIYGWEVIVGVFFFLIQNKE